MKSHQGKAFNPLVVKFLFILLAVSSFSSPMALFAEEINLKLLTTREEVALMMPEKTSGGHLALGVDDDGNVMLRSGNTSVTFIYTPPDGSQDVRDHIGMVPCPNCSGFGGVSVKLGMAF